MKRFAFLFLLRKRPRIKSDSDSAANVCEIAFACPALAERFRVCCSILFLDLVLGGRVRRRRATCVKVRALRSSPDCDNNLICGVVDKIRVDITNHPLPEWCVWALSGALQTDHSSYGSSQTGGAAAQLTFWHHQKAPRGVGFVYPSRGRDLGICGHHHTMTDCKEGKRWLFAYSNLGLTAHHHSLGPTSSPSHIFKVAGFFHFFSVSHFVAKHQTGLALLSSS